MCKGMIYSYTHTVLRILCYEYCVTNTVYEQHSFNFFNIITVLTTALTYFYHDEILTL